MKLMTKDQISYRNLLLDRKRFAEKKVTDFGKGVSLEMSFAFASAEAVRSYRDARDILREFESDLAGDGVGRFDLYGNFVPNK